VVAGYKLDPDDAPGVPVSCSYSQLIAPSISPDEVALDGIVPGGDGGVGSGGAGAGGAGAGGAGAVPLTINVVLITGHIPLLVHDLKWIVWLPAART
jgi:hypothetical protein